MSSHYSQRLLQLAGIKAAAGLNDNISRLIGILIYFGLIDVVQYRRLAGTNNKIPRECTCIPQKAN
jgi:hypothetical protein